MLDRPKWVLDNIGRAQVTFSLVGALGVVGITASLARAVTDLPPGWLWVLGFGLGLVVVAVLGVVALTRGDSPAPIVPMTHGVFYQSFPDHLYLLASVYVTNESPVLDLQPVSFVLVKWRTARRWKKADITGHFSIHDGRTMWVGGSIPIRPNETRHCQPGFRVDDAGLVADPPARLEVLVHMVDQRAHRHPVRLVLRPVPSEPSDPAPTVAAQV